MNALKGIYHKGMVELFEKPGKMETSEVLVIFPDKQKKITRIGALFQGCKINYGDIDKELKKLSKQSQKHILTESERQTDSE